MKNSFHNKINYLLLGFFLCIGIPGIPATVLADGTYDNLRSGYFERLIDEDPANPIDRPEITWFGDDIGGDDIDYNGFGNPFCLYRVQTGPADSTDRFGLWYSAPFSEMGEEWEGEILEGEFAGYNNLGNSGILEYWGYETVDGGEGNCEFSDPENPTTNVTPAIPRPSTTDHSIVDNTVFFNINNPWEYDYVVVWLIPHKFDAPPPTPPTTPPLVI